MASSSTPSSFTTLTKKHEVFLSFRGEDTRYGFTSHLYDALCRKKIETFIDDKLERGDEISPALLRAIEGSKIAVVIFSKNYASSKWCLRELAEIIKCKKMNKHIVMPVFYHVDPSDVRKLTGSFNCSFANEEKELQEEVQKWREALTEASNQSGWDCSVIRDESKLVGDIVESVWRKLMNEYISASSDFEGLIGIHKRIEEIISLSCLDMEDVRIIGIWGMGGIGKTTIAQAVFKFISYKFDGACFVEKVGKRLENDGPNRPIQFVHSDHMLLGYCSFYSSFQNPEKLPADDSDYVNISIEFKSINCHNQLKRCAVHPIYAEPTEKIGATIQDIGETSGLRSDRSDDNDEEVEPYPKRICTQANKTLDLFH